MTSRSVAGRESPGKREFSTFAQGMAAHSTYGAWIEVGKRERIGALPDKF